MADIFQESYLMLALNNESVISITMLDLDIVDPEQQRPNVLMLL